MIGRDGMGGWRIRSTCGRARSGEGLWVLETVEGPRGRVNAVRAWAEGLGAGMRAEMRLGGLEGR